MLKLLYEGLLDLVYPPSCYLCKVKISNRLPAEGVCPDCESKIIINKPPRCLICSRPIKRPVISSLCKVCQEHRPKYDFAWSALVYNDDLKRLLISYKFYSKTLLRHYFAQKMCSFIDDLQLDIHQFDLIIPVPLHSTRERERGYNQAALLANLIAENYKIPYLDNILIRDKYTPSQSKMAKKDRWTNVHKAFKINNFNSIQGKNILIIDDLLTTGATVSEAAKTLKKSEVGIVAVFTLAITP